MEEYRRSTNNAQPERGHAAIALLEGVGYRELPDATLTEAQRQDLKCEALRLEARYSSYELIFLSSALEPAANRKRAEELSHD
jgi:hypothetical protein